MPVNRQLCELPWKEEGSGVVLTAPGDDEYNSYIEFVNREGFLVQGFDDPEFLPSAGLRKTEGLVKALKLLNSLYKRCKQDLEEDNGLKYRLLGLDRIDGFAQLAVNIMLKKCGLEEAPAAHSKDGMQYYVGIQNLMNQLMRPIRACRGLGMHLIVTSHVQEKEVKGTSMAELKGAAYMPLIPGSFREQLPGIFDVVLYAGVNKAGKVVDGRNDPKSPRHFVQWMPDPKKPTKSRVGALAPAGRLPNEWDVLKPLIDAALERRSSASTSLTAAP